MQIPIEQHNLEIRENLKSWEKKPLLREIYSDFYKLILERIRKDLPGPTVELGSGIGNFKSIYPAAIATDIFPNPWIDQVESAYSLSFSDNSLSNLILFDVFHHLAYLGSSLQEFKRVLLDDGRVVIFDPCTSLLGLIVYGAFHHEPIAIFKKINWFAPEGVEKDREYYAAQGNATRVFRKNSEWRKEVEKDWNILEIKKMSAISYVLSGGFSKPILYPSKMLYLLKIIDKFCDWFPLIFATRMLVVLEKK